jgi:hypothetical protein
MKPEVDLDLQFDQTPFRASKPEFIFVVIESPYGSDDDAVVAENVKYLDRCILDCLARGETPYASHKMLTTALDDRNPKQRALGIAAWLAVRRIAVRRVFYTDRGWSDGMLEAKALYDAEKITYEEREVGCLVATLRAPGVVSEG